MRKIEIFKEPAWIFPDFGSPKWVVRRIGVFEKTFDTGDEALRFARDLIDRLTVTARSKKLHTDDINEQGINHTS